MSTPAHALRRRLEAHADPARSVQEARYLKLQNRRVLGAGVPNVYRVARGYARDFGLPRDLEVIDSWFRASLEEALCAVQFLGAQAAFSSHTWSLVEDWCANPDTWALADPIATILVAGHLEDGVIDESLLRGWARREEPFWFRRIALVATTSLNSGLGGPTKRRLGLLGRTPRIGRRPRPDLTLDLLGDAIGDTRHFIRLAIGWSLRDLSKVAPAQVERFVLAHRAHFTKAMLNKARLGEDGRPV